MDAVKLIVSIVERGKGVAMQRLYDQRQVFLHLQCAGRGTATSEILDILGLGSSEKDVVFSFAAAPSAQLLLHDLDNDLRGSVGTSGIVFSLPLTGLNNLAAALVDFRASAGKKGNGGDTPMEHSAESTLILVACARGHSDAVMTTAKAQGARGGTVIKGRLSGLEDLEQAYGLELNAEREIVAIVVPKDRRAPIMEAVNAAHGLRSPAQTVVCSLPIDQIVRLG